MEAIRIKNKGRIKAQRGWAKAIFDDQFDVLWKRIIKALIVCNVKSYIVGRRFSWVLCTAKTKWFS